MDIDALSRRQVLLGLGAHCVRLQMFFLSHSGDPNTEAHDYRS
jgi:hypothetical protein